MEPAVLLQSIGEGVDPHVFLLVDAEPEVRKPVVGGDLVDVMDDSLRCEASTDGPLHHEPMLTDLDRKSTRLNSSHYALSRMPYH